MLHKPLLLPQLVLLPQQLSLSRFYLAQKLHIALSGVVFSNVKDEVDLLCVSELVNLVVDECSQ